MGSRANDNTLCKTKLTCPIAFKALLGSRDSCAPRPEKGTFRSEARHWRGRRVSRVRAKAIWHCGHSSARSVLGRQLSKNEQRKMTAKAYHRSMAALHISEADLARDLHAVLEQVRQGCEVVIERDQQPVALLRPPERRHRTLSESIEIARRREEQRGYAVTLDADFAADVGEVVRQRKPWNPPEWD
jgi:antitoxin (DNA-binding transcriptional repressor) of toxin-antitoxin stability system